MANGTARKRYYWLKLHDDFFDTLRIKKLRRAEGGDTLALIYLKLLLKSMKSDGVLTFNGIEEDLAEELALDLGEETANVRATLGFLEASGLMKRRRDGSAYFPEAVANTGSETAAAQRMRDSRMRRKSSSSSVTTLQKRYKSVTPALQVGCVEKEIETEKEIDTRDRDKIKETEERERLFTGEAPSPSRPYPPPGTGTACFGFDNGVDNRTAPDMSKNGVLKLGEYRNVKLTNGELDKIKAEFPTDWQARIENLSAYIASTGRSYRSHLATIRNWARMERERAAPRGKGYEGDNVFLAIAKEEGIV